MAGCRGSAPAGESGQSPAKDSADRNGRFLNSNFSNSNNRAIFYAVLKLNGFVSAVLVSAERARHKLAVGKIRTSSNLNVESL